MIKMRKKTMTKEAQVEYYKGAIKGASELSQKYKKARDVLADLNLLNMENKSACYTVLGELSSKLAHAQKLEDKYVKLLQEAEPSEKKKDND